MLETYFSASKLLVHLRSGPSGPYLDSFAATLERQGYSAATAVRYLRAAAHLGHVVARQGAIPSDIDLAVFTCALVDVRASWEGVATTTPFSAPGAVQGGRRFCEVWCARDTLTLLRAMSRLARARLCGESSGS